MRDSLLRGESPFASHLLYTQVLDDGEPAQRRIGMEAGFMFYSVAKLCAVYLDYGMSEGMLAGIERAKAHKVPIEQRLLEMRRIEPIERPLMLDLPYPAGMRGTE